MSKPLPETPEDELPSAEISVYERSVVYPDGQLGVALASLPSPAGRPTKFDPDHHPEHALAMAAEGYSYGMIASVFEVVVATLYNWRDKHPEFKAVWPMLKSKRRSAIELEALRNVRGLNTSKTAHGMLAQMDRYEQEESRDDEGKEYLDPRIHKVENDTQTTNALANIANALADQAGMTLKTRSPATESDE